MFYCTVIEEDASWVSSSSFLSITPSVLSQGTDGGAQWVKVTKTQRERKTKRTIYTGSPFSNNGSILFCQQFAVASFHFGGVGEAEDKGLVFAVIQDALPLFT